MRHHYLQRSIVPGIMLNNSHVMNVNNWWRLGDTERSLIQISMPVAFLAYKDAP